MNAPPAEQRRDPPRKPRIRRHQRCGLARALQRFPHQQRGCFGFRRFIRRFCHAEASQAVAHKFLDRLAACPGQLLQRRAPICRFFCRRQRLMDKANARTRRSIRRNPGPGRHALRRPAQCLQRTYQCVLRVARCLDNSVPLLLIQRRIQPGQYDQAFGQLKYGPHQDTSRRRCAGGAGNDHRSGGWRLLPVVSQRLRRAQSLLVRI